MTAPVTEPAAGADTGAASARGSRDARLADAVAQLRAAGRRFRLERHLHWIGGVLVPLGVMLVILGWYGASHTSRVYLQIPYLISGGLLGVGCIFAGGFFYFAHWMTHLVQDGRREAQEARAMASRTVAALERIEALLRDGAAAGPVSAPRGEAGAALVATPKGRLAHRPDCSMVAGRRDVRTLNGNASGLEPCRICQPELVG